MTGGPESFTTRMCSNASRRTPPINLIMLGNSDVGKTAMTNRYCKNQFSDYLNITIGLDFGEAIHKRKLDGQEYKVVIWDTAGQERYGTITKNHYRNSQGAVLVYDLTSDDSLEHIEKWMGDLTDNAKEP
eukprot:UN21371